MSLPLHEISNLMNPTLPKVGEVVSHKPAMQLCLDSAYLGLGRVSPNPLVGCVILDENHRFLAAGYHRKYGELHAEAAALAAIPASAKYNSLIVYVSLEPCNHVGRQPACAHTLAKLPIQTLYYAMRDPNPIAAKGLEHLQQAGISCEVWDDRQLAAKAEELIRMFLWNQTHNKLYVSLKVATDADGNFALVDSKKLWITNESSRQYAHFLRASHDVIAVGVRTVLLDDPILDTRFFDSSLLPPAIAIFDANAELTEDVFQNLAMRKLKRPIYWIVGNHTNPQSIDAIEKWSLPYQKGIGFDQVKLEEMFWQKGLRSLLLEGGARLYATYLEAHRVNRIYHFMSPNRLEQENKRLWTDKMSVLPKFADIVAFKLADDTLIVSSLDRVT